MYNGKLREMIRNEGISQYDFANRLRISSATLSKVINGKRKKTAIRQLIADYFNVSVETIFGGKNHVGKK